MVFDGNNLVVYGQNRRAHETAVGAFVCRWKALGRTCAGIFLEFEHVDMLLVRAPTKRFVAEGLRYRNAEFCSLLSAQAV